MIVGDSGLMSEVKLMKPYLRNLQGDAIQLLQERGPWIVAGVETTIFWPRTTQVVPYASKDFILRPGTEDNIPTIAFNANKYGFDLYVARDEILSFTSALAWTGKGRLEIVGWTGGGYPIQMMRGKMQAITDYLDPSLLEPMKNEADQTILAFFREGLASRNPFYAFLNFFKVVAFAYKDGRERGNWIRQALTQVARGRPLERFQQLHEEYGGNVDKYLFEQGRNAIAHAEKDIFINPDKLVDHQRIHADLPLIRFIAELTIQDRHGFATDSYELVANRALSGFLALIPPDVLHKLRDGGDLGDASIEIPDYVTFVARVKAEAVAMENFHLVAGEMGQAGIKLDYQDSSESVRLRFEIDIKNNILIFDPLTDIAIQQKMESLETIDAVIKVHLFIWCMYRNGALEVWNDSNDTFLGRSSPYILKNMYIEPEGHETEMQRLYELRAAIAGNVS